MQPIYTSRRGTINNSRSNNFARNYNTVRHTKRNLGAISQIIIVFLLTIVFGLIYATQGTKAVGFDYEISDVEDQISEMNAKKDDLNVEKARLNSIATAENSTVAASMEDATVTGYVTEQLPTSKRRTHGFVAAADSSTKRYNVGVARGYFGATVCDSNYRASDVGGKS